MPIRTNIHSLRHVAIINRRLPKLAANWRDDARQYALADARATTFGTARTAARDEGAAASAAAAAARRVMSCEKTLDGYLCALLVHTNINFVSCSFSQHCMRQTLSPWNNVKQDLSG